MFGQTFAPADLLTLAVLVLLEGVLSIDNALVLGLLSLRVPARLRIRALSYGLIGSLVLRLAAVMLAVFLLHWTVVKLAGGLYLVWIGGRHSLKSGSSRRKSRGKSTANARFWSTVMLIELVDLAFAADSILAAVALVGPIKNGAFIHPKLWLIMTGGMIGVILMRFAAAIFSRLLERFPSLDVTAYRLVLLIGVKLVAEWMFDGRVDFQDPHNIWFWIFWGALALCLAFGFRTRKIAAQEAHLQPPPVE